MTSSNQAVKSIKLFIEVITEIFVVVDFLVILKRRTIALTTTIFQLGQGDEDEQLPYMCCLVHL